jgi:hypothetical protein
MTTWILFAALAGVALAALVVRLVRARARRKHDPVEYYMGWGGYHHPIGLQNRITKEQGDALAAEGSAYLIGYFDADGKLTRVVKLFRGEFFFEYLYTYHPNGRLKSTKVTRGGRVTLLEYDERGRRPPGQRTAF